MKSILRLSFIAIVVLGLIHNVNADVFIPDNEIVGYVDSNGIYTVVGAVRNTDAYPVLPVVFLTVSDEGKKLDVVQELPTVFPDKDIPFKIKIPQVGHDAVILGSKIEFEKDLLSSESNVEIVYDKTLTKHADGHLTGTIMNKGNQTEYNIKIYATIHGENNSLIDVAKNLEKINKIEPGQVLEFTMYPDPSIAKDIHYYSCFVLGDETIVPLSTTRGNEKFNFRYDSTASFVVKGFDKTGTELSIMGINSFKFPTFVNFEFPKTANIEKFTVHVDNEPVNFIQSLDDEGNWHIAFDIPEAAQNEILISGFIVPNSTTLPSKVSEQITSESSFLYYVIPIIVAGSVVVYIFSRKNAQRQV
jgi:hypothetical protein